MIAHRLNVRGPVVSHGLNPIDPSVPVLLVSPVFVGDVQGDQRLDLSPRLELDVVADVPGDFEIDGTARLELDLEEDVDATLDLRKAIKVTE